MQNFLNFTQDYIEEYYEYDPQSWDYHQQWETYGVKFVMEMNKPLHERTKIIKDYLDSKKDGSVTMKYEMFVKTEVLPGRKSVP